MLGNARQVMTMIPVKDFERARQFYTEVLGLTEKQLIEGTPPTFVTEDGASIALYEPNLATSPTHTLISFVVDDLEAVVSHLKSHDVEFEHVEMGSGSVTGKDGIMVTDVARIA